MTLTYWSGYSKRKNSTKQPTSGTDVTIKLKDNCSVVNPAFQTSTVPITANYFYIADFGRYYFLSNLVQIAKDIWEFTLEVDVLASYKSAIGSCSAQIGFSSTGYDTMKVDSRLPVKVTKTITSANGTGVGLFDAQGCYVLAVSNVESNMSMVCYYAVDQANMQTLMQELLTNTSLKAAVHEYCTDVWDAIISCTWVPFERTMMPGSISDMQIVVANEITSAVGRKLNNPSVRTASDNITIPWTYSDFRRTSPFSSINAWIPGYGFIELNAADLASLTALRFEFTADCSTGDIVCRVANNDGSEYYQSISYNMGVQIPLSNFTMDAQGVIQNTTGFLSNATNTALSAGALNIAGVVSGAFSMLSSGASTVLAANKREVSVKGTQGGRAVIAMGTDVTLFVFSIDTEDPDSAAYIARWGRPVGLTHAISNHSGYIECIGAYCDMTGTAIEKERVNTYLNTGFYYE